MKPITSAKTKYLSLAKSVRKYCLIRCEDGVQCVRLCEDTECPLHPYRMGKNPNRVGIGGGKRPSLPEKGHSSGVIGTEKKKLGVESGSSGLSSPRASGKEIHLIKMSAVGKVQMVGKKIIIELT